MKQFLVKLAPNKIIVGNWPATKFGPKGTDGRVQNANSAAEAIHEVGDELGITSRSLIAEEVR